ncbi:MAG: sensor histidine kinase [Psychroflexus halocasei]
MNLFGNKDLARLFIIFSSLTIVILVSWNVFLFFDRIKKDERQKMKVWAEAQKSLNTANDNQDLDLELFVMSHDINIPMINTDADGNILRHHNIKKFISEDSIELYNELNTLKNTNKPIEVNMGEGNKQFIYYGNSDILEKIKYYPAILLLIFFLFLSLIYVFFKTSKTSEKNKLWAGMAKETAHQIGTPLSSLVGWMEILKSDPNVQDSYVVEMEKDVNRLHKITDRFSKIGSEVEYENLDIIKETQLTVDYIMKRHSKLITFDVNLDQSEEAIVSLNDVLYSWTLENLIKNAVDAMRGKGKITIESKVTQQWVSIYISDEGKGIESNKFKQVFEAGYTSKKRGWGLGLSLAKRIIEDYHHGKIRVKHSEINKGTCFEIRLKRVS